MLLSVVVPCYNEQEYLEQSIRNLLAITHAGLQLDVIIVDDGSKDASREIAGRLVTEFPQQLRLIEHGRNQGKGAALMTGFNAARGELLCVHDADLEYDPSDILRLLKPLERGVADVVIGSRFTGHEMRRVMFFWHTHANKGLTMLSNMGTNLNLTDMECCYKLFRRDYLPQIKLTEKRFGIEPELVSRLAALRVNGHKPRIYEVGVNYHGRSYEEGKKIKLKDAFRALWVIIRCRFD